MKFRPACLALSLGLLPFAALAAVPPGQIGLSSGKILRGHFTEDRLIQGMNGPLHMEGHFTIDPANGLIWMMEKPLPTTTIVTQDRMVQDIGGIALKLPAKNLRHLYDLIGSALAGNWDGFDNDFDIVQSGGQAHWKIVLTPRPNGNAKMDYASITVTGGSFVEQIIAVKNDGSSDALNFTEAVLSPAPATAKEAALFREAGPQPQ